MMTVEEFIIISTQVKERERIFILLRVFRLKFGAAGIIRPRYQKEFECFGVLFTRCST